MELCKFPELLGLAIMIKVLCIVILGFVTNAWSFDQTHHLYANVLKNYTRNGMVNYSALKKNPQDLDAYLASITELKREDFDKWPSLDRLALLINLFNAATIRLVLNDYPIKSIKDAVCLKCDPWAKEVVQIFGKKISLKTLEDHIIFRGYPDARVHYCLCYAAMSSPPLRSEPYLGAQLYDQMNDQGSLFLSNGTINRVDPKARIIFLSPIFKWYSQDFIVKKKPLVDSLLEYFPINERKILENGNWKIKYTHFDWSLNDMR